MSNSYAEQFFGTKQNLVLQYAENLAFFGEESYVYRDAGLMKEIIDNKIALLNPTTAYYAYLWARENGYKAVDYFNVGLVIAIYNSDLNATYHFVLVDFNDDGSGLFINREPCLMLPASSVSNGLEVLNYEDYEIVQFLNNEKNWYSKWENKPSSTPETFASTNGNLYKKVRFLNGFLNGFDYKLKKLLKTFKDGYNFPVLPINYDEFNNAVMRNLNYKENFTRINENCYNFYVNNASIAIPSNVVIGGRYYGWLMEEATVEQITARPTYRAGYTFEGGSAALETLQANTSTGVATILASCPVNLKIQF